MTIRVCEAMNAPVGRLSDRTVCEANGGVLPRQVLIDADGCPVVDLTLQIAKQFSVPVIILCDTAHQIERESAQTLVFDKGADSVDFALVNRVKPGDVVVTQDYGLASMCLAKCARVLNQNGLEYTADNIDALMLRRYENKKLLRAGKHPKAAFDEANLKKLPKVKELDTEYSKLLTEKKALYPDYRKAKEEMQELLRAKRNVELFFAEEKSSTEKTKSR